jgi:urate oxidase
MVLFGGHPVDSLVIADNMADNMSNSAAEENVNISLEDFLNNLAKRQLDIDHC